MEKNKEKKKQISSYPLRCHGTHQRGTAADRETAGQSWAKLKRTLYSEPITDISTPIGIKIDHSERRSRSDSAVVVSPSWKNKKMLHDIQPQSITTTCLRSDSR